MSNPILENIKARRAIREFEDKAVAPDAIDKITEAGRFAPSALNRQPWQFIVVTDKGIIAEFTRVVRERVKKIYRLLPVLKAFVKELRDERVAAAIKKTATRDDDTVFYGAPLVIIVANDRNIKDSKADCVFAAQNMMLAAHALGIGSCVIGRGKLIPMALLRKKFNIDKDYGAAIFIAFGYPKGPRRAAAPRKDNAVKKF